MRAGRGGQTAGPQQSEEQGAQTNRPWRPPRAAFTGRPRLALGICTITGTVPRHLRDMRANLSHACPLYRNYAGGKTGAPQERGDTLLGHRRGASDRPFGAQATTPPEVCTRSSMRGGIRGAMRQGATCGASATPPCVALCSTAFHLTATRRAQVNARCLRHDLIQTMRVCRARRSMRGRNAK